MVAASKCWCVSHSGRHIWHLGWNRDRRSCPKGVLQRSCSCRSHFTVEKRQQISLEGILQRVGWADTGDFGGWIMSAESSKVEMAKDPEVIRSNTEWRLQVWSIEFDKLRWHQNRLTFVYCKTSHAHVQKGLPRVDTNSTTRIFILTRRFTGIQKRAIERNIMVLFGSLALEKNIACMEY